MGVVGGRDIEGWPYFLRAESLVRLLEACTEGSHAVEASGPGQGVLPEADLNLFNLFTSWGEISSFLNPTDQTTSVQGRWWTS